MNSTFKSNNGININQGGNNSKAHDAVSGDGKVISERAELMFWDTIKNSSNPADFNTEKPFAVKNSDRKGADVLLLNNQATEVAEKNAENARIAREQDEARKRAEAARIAREQNEKKKKRRIISTF